MMTHFSEEVPSALRRHSSDRKGLCETWVSCSFGKFCCFLSRVPNQMKHDFVLVIVVGNTMLQVRPPISNITPFRALLVAVVGLILLLLDI